MAFKVSYQHRSDENGRIVYAPEVASTYLDNIVGYRAGLSELTAAKEICLESKLSFNNAADSRLDFYLSQQIMLLCRAYWLKLEWSSILVIEVVQLDTFHYTE